MPEYPLLNLAVQRPEPEPAAIKRCTKCGDVKPLGGFSRATKASDGLQASCKTCQNEYNHRYYAANRAALQEQQRQYREGDPEAHRERVRKWRAALRRQVFGHYGTACACCGTTKNLTIDHVNGQGARHRHELFGTQRAGADRFYVWLLDQGFPPGYQTLCRTCNLSKSSGERCYLHRAEPPGRTLIFNLYSRVKVKLGDEEEHIFDRTRLMYTEVAEVEKVTGLSYAEWERELNRYSITAIAALIHVLRKREGIPTDFATMQFNAATMDCIPVHDDGTEYTPAEITADMLKRMEAAKAGPGPTRGAEETVAAEAPVLEATTITSPSSPVVTASARGNGNGSRGGTSPSSKRTLTRT